VETPLARAPCDINCEEGSMIGGHFVPQISLLACGRAFRPYNLLGFLMPIDPKGFT